MPPDISSCGFLDFDGDSELDIDEPPRTTEPVVETHPDAGGDFGEGFHTLRGVDNHDMYPEERKKNLFYPFLDEDDFAMAAWLNESGASMAHIDAFLKMPFVSRPFCFTSALHNSVFNSLRLRTQRNCRSEARRKCT